MTIYDGYATRADLLQRLMQPDEYNSAASANTYDDLVIDDIITDASRAVDHFCDRQFFASAQTFYCDVPPDNTVWFGRDVLAVQGASAGDGTPIAGSTYYLWPRNANSFAAAVVKPGASGLWPSVASGDPLIFAASVGFCDRAASAASDSARNRQIIANTHEATLIRAAIVYRQRHNQSVYERNAKDEDWQALVQGYVRGVA